MANPVRSRRLAVALAVADTPRLARRASSGDSTPIAFDVHFENRRVVDKAIYGGKRHCGVREDTRPFAKWLIRGNYQAASQ
jgi:hypothetical protein